MQLIIKMLTVSAPPQLNAWIRHIMWPQAVYLDLPLSTLAQFVFNTTSSLLLE